MGRVDDAKMQKYNKICTDVMTQWNDRYREILRRNGKSIQGSLKRYGELQMYSEQCRYKYMKYVKIQAYIIYKDTLYAEI